MSVSNHFLLHTVEAMASISPVSYRRIFNGYGIYHEGIQFAIVINDHIYFRADDYSRGLYLAQKMTSFQPSVLAAIESSFFQVPEDVLNNQSELKYWMRIAVEAAQNAYAPEDEESFTEIPVRHLHIR